MSRREKEVRELLEAGCAASEEDFRRLAGVYAQRRQLREASGASEAHLGQFAGEGAALETFKVELTATPPESLQEEKAALADQIAGLEGAKKEKTGQCAELRLRLKQLEESQDASKLRLEEQVALAEVEGAAHEWAVLSLARHLINQAREKYERERRPAVLKEAERFFSVLTGGRYAAVSASAGESVMRVRTPEGKTLEVEELSRGTAEQLYLALRFGFVQEFVKWSEPLPLILDDILVNFDPKRARAAVETVLELSQKHQVLLFTCHPETVELVKGIEKDVPVLGLE